MSDDVALSVPVGPKRAPRLHKAVVFFETARRTVRSGALWGLLFGIVVASSALSYTRIYATQADRDKLAAAFGSDRATAALFGPARELQTVAGFTVFKSFMTIMVLGAVWGLLTSTRVLRGEEDAGRWELMLTGRTTPGRATAQALAALAAGAGTLWLVTAIITVWTGRNATVDIATGPSLYFALAQVAAAVMFLAVGSFTSQFAATRRRAATLAGWFLGVSYVLRMVADAGVGLHALVWVTPLGWVEEMQPLTSPNPAALLPIAAFTAVVGVLAVLVSGERDVGASIFPDRSRAPAHFSLLSGQVGLSVRLMRPVLMGWLAALAATGFVLGLIAKQGGGSIAGSSVQEVFTRLGASGTGAEAFLGVSFLSLAVMAGFLAAGQVTMMRGEEAEGRLDHLAVQPVARSSWLWGRVLVAALVLVLAGVVVGVVTWLGAETQGGSVSLGTLLEAGVNIVPPALCVLGVGVLAFGLLPGATSYVVYGLLGWSLLIEIVGGVGGTRRWLLDTSLFHQMAAAPAVSPNWTANAVMTAVGVVAAGAGALGLGRRDLRGA